MKETTMNHPYNPHVVPLRYVTHIGCWRCLGLGAYTKAPLTRDYEAVACGECARTGRDPIPFSEVWGL